MSTGHLHQTPPRSPWPRRLLILGRNTTVGFAAGVTMWVFALLFAARVSRAFLGAHAADGAWQAAWTPSGFLYAGALVAVVAALLTAAVWAVIDQRNGFRS
ncbi:hypothetical protein [Curtobacterium sp. VKM Ac-2887]|uniref:hypothetical protein n=1 Tax=Curtobacterium sp. VKM Ac-2887 TaxID=2783819 RepID=UPI00188D72FB|nr:hypothetical protein [Curtobacterium sp. VKM Ac-2887]MBF4587947.1 hypothetical protein [Curtobacterium sp. VKM Ac-2887]